MKETAQHLHFYVTDANSPLESEGLPYVLESFEQLAAPNMWERRQERASFTERAYAVPHVGRCDVNRSVHSHSFCRICPDRADRR